MLVLTRRIDEKVILPSIPVEILIIDVRCARQIWSSSQIGD